MFLTGHPECAERVPAILSALENSGLTTYERPDALVQLEEFLPAPLEAVLAVHVDKSVATCDFPLFCSPALARGGQLGVSLLTGACTQIS